jgi:hypothetical protein
MRYKFSRLMEIFDLQNSFSLKVFKPLLFIVIQGLRGDPMKAGLPHERFLIKKNWFSSF